MKRPSRKTIAIAVLGMTIWIFDGFLRPFDLIARFHRRLTRSRWIEGPIDNPSFEESPRGWQ